MKKRNIITVLSALVCLAFLSITQAAPAPKTPDPGSTCAFCTADGTNALANASAGGGTANSAFGWWALFSDTDAGFNTAVGAGALLFNNGSPNTAVGATALLFNTTGSDMTAVGVGALQKNQIASDNNAVGAFALFNNDSDAAGLGNNNTAVGANALEFNVDGSENTAVGTGAGPNVVTGFNNTYIGDFVGTLSADESNTIRIGDLSNGNGAGSLACFIGGIFNNFQPVGGSVVEVTLDLANDELGWDVGPNRGGSAPVQRGASQPGARPQRQAMLNDKVEKLQGTVAQQQKQIETLRAQLRQQAAQIQKVSAQLEVNKPTAKVVTNKP
jgi:hypothetical protein